MLSRVSLGIPVLFLLICTFLVFLPLYVRPLEVTFEIDSLSRTLQQKTFLTISETGWDGPSHYCLWSACVHAVHQMEGQACVVSASFV